MAGVGLLRATYLSIGWKGRSDCHTNTNHEDEVGLIVTHGSTILVVVSLLSLTGCIGERTPTLNGTWSGQSREGDRLTLVFDDSDRMLWIAERAPGVRDTTVLSYRVDSAAVPRQIDISGFTSGEMAGMTLYGIYELLGPDSLRLDFEPGLPGERAVRPDGFTAEAGVYVRR